VNDERLSRMLYDHQADPRETVNLADRPENRALVLTLSGLLADGWQRAARADNKTPIPFDVLPDGRIVELPVSR